MMPLLSLSKRAKAAKRLAKDMRLLHNSPFMDAVWYRQTYPDLRSKPVDCAWHYLEHGAREGRNPHPLFDTKFYLRQYPDVAASGMNPLVHYILHGQREGRRPNPYSSSLTPQTSAPTNGRVSSRRGPPVGAPARQTLSGPITSLVALFRGKERLSPKMQDIAPHFDAQFYLQENPDVAEAKLDPLKHFLELGWREGRDPAPWFSTNYYLSANPDVAEANINPFW